MSVEGMREAWNPLVGSAHDLYGLGGQNLAAGRPLDGGAFSELTQALDRMLEASEQLRQQGDAALRSARGREYEHDGFNDSDALSRVFTATGAPPEVVITTQFAGGTTLSPLASPQLTGVAVDQAGEILTGGRLRWFDGRFALGSGSAVSSGPLHPGVNHIRLVARDPKGRSATARMVVTVGPVNLPFLTLQVPAAVRPAATKLSLRAGATIPATLIIGAHRFQLGAVRAVRLPISSGKAPLLLHMTLLAGNGVTNQFTELVPKSAAKQAPPPPVHP